MYYKLESTLYSNNTNQEQKEQLGNGKKFPFVANPFDYEPCIKQTCTFIFLIT